jgi:putative NIF3 family GTP cyclohydrolase 1 type 2
MISGSTWLAAAVMAAAIMATAATGQAEPPPPGQAPAKKVVNPAEQAATARAVLQRAQVLAQRISQMLEEARREADIIRVTCLNDKLTQVNANMRTAQTRMAAYDNASDPEQKNHEATVISVLGQKFQVLDQEANRCVGQDLYETGTTKVQTLIDTAMQPFDENVGTPAPPPPPAVPDVPIFVSGTK